MICNLPNTNNKTIDMKGLLVVGVMLLSASAFSQEVVKDRNYYKNSIVGRYEMKQMIEKQNQQNNMQKDKQNSRVYIKDKQRMNPTKFEK